MCGEWVGARHCGARATRHVMCDVFRALREFPVATGTLPPEVWPCHPRSGLSARGLDRLLAVPGTKAVVVDDAGGEASAARRATGVPGPKRIRHDCLCSLKMSCCEERRGEDQGKIRGKIRGRSGEETETLSSNRLAAAATAAAADTTHITIRSHHCLCFDTNSTHSRSKFMFCSQI